ncbi:MAG: sigma-54 dependent transcriptional regulator [Deltaproteobacteria bacterium]|nr:sigma-54 dependent transcriptional regulator [Deltaproteobacteria bacterium]
MAHANGKGSILVVDDAATTIEVIERNLVSAGYGVITAMSATEAMDILEARAVDLVVTDLKMPGPSGMELVKYVRQTFPDTEAMMITGYATVEGAVEAVKTGAEEYLAKPFTDGELISAVERTFEKLRVRRAAHSEDAAPIRTPMGFIGDSAAMERVYRAIAKAAVTRATVLISGESGTGKELVARAIHYTGPRSGSPFVAVNCGGIPEALLESELFGHVKGAFTGASETRAGFFQTADGGTIFLDEVSEMTLGMQVKLLRVLQEEEVRMVGSSRTRKVDVRVLAATNKSLPALVVKGLFRDDLFYRLNVIAIDVPPLRDRGDDVLAMINHFARKYAGESDRPVPTFTGEALRVLRGYHWPGNARELQNMIHRMVVMCDGSTIDVRDLPALMHFVPPREKRLDRTLVEVEVEHIRNVLDSVGGNKTQAAEILGIDRKTLREKLKPLKPAP